jgi:hydroxyethylthiazole kinase-like uncharacterized protein yjeF
VKIASAAEMRRLDELATTDYDIPSIVLMENAGLRVVEAVKHILGNVSGKRILVFAGKGNNGGDGLVVTRHLFNAGAEVKTFLLAPPEEIKGDARINLAIAQKMQAKICPVLVERDLQRVDIALLYPDLIVDAIYGTGFKGAAQGVAGRVIEMINRVGKPVVAVDLPSGLEADTGNVHGPCIQATETITFCLPKLGLVLDPGARYTGRLTVADISIPAGLVDRQNIRRELLSASWCAARLTERDAAGHKGSYGHVVVAGGAVGMTGAVAMTGLAALRAGAGLVTVGVPRSLNAALEIKTQEVMTRPLPETDTSSLGLEALEPLLSLTQEATVLAIGPGMSRHPGGALLLQKLLPQLTVPVVIDADGLNLLAEKLEVLKEVTVPVVLTPHPGEMARLLGANTTKVQSNRLAVAGQAAREWGVCVVLKGSGTVIASPEGDLYLNPTGNPGMATAGAGDVLTGVIAGACFAKSWQILPPAATLSTCIPRQIARIGLRAANISGTRAISKASLSGVIFPVPRGSSPKKKGSKSPPPDNNNPSISRAYCPATTAETPAGNNTGTAPLFASACI